MKQRIGWMMNMRGLLISAYSAPVFADGTPVDETRPTRANGHIEIGVVQGDLSNAASTAARDSAFEPLTMRGKPARRQASGWKCSARSMLRY